VTAAPIPVADVLDLRDEGRIDLAPVVAATQEADVDVGVLTDEEVHWLTGVDAVPRARLDAPRLGALDPERQIEALDLVMLVLLARGDVTRSPDGLRVHGRHALIAELREGSRAATSVQVDIRGEGSRWSAIYRVSPELFLFEDVLPEGLHRFLLCSPQRQAALLARTVDPRAAAASTSTAQHADSVDGLVPHPGELVARSQTSAIALLGVPGDDGSVRATAFTAYGDGDGLWLLQVAPERSAAALQTLSPDDLVAYCSAFLGSR